MKCGKSGSVEFRVSVQNMYSGNVDAHTSPDFVALLLSGRSAAG